MTKYAKGKLYNINLNDLLADPDQPRKVIDTQGMEDMTASVGKLGVSRLSSEPPQTAA